ncbi:hypothetical protein AF42_03187 [Citrobacter freundii MGH 56]|nr:hypothetical protein AF42_03187 [Citrobacter freundii MGH 56]
MSLYRRVVLLSLLGMSSGAQSASHEQIMQIYNSGSVGSVIKCQAHMDVKSGDGTIPVQIMSVMTITGRQFHHLYYDSAIIYSIVNAEKPYMYVSVSVEENIQEEQRKIRSELDLSTLRVDFPGNPEMANTVRELFREQRVTYANYTDITVSEPPSYTVRQYSKDSISGVILQTCTPMAQR